MKNKKTTLSKKLKSYSSLAGAMAAIGNIANAQIVYTDIIDQTVTGTAGMYNLDLDNSGNTDFILSAVGSSSADVITATPLNSNAVGANVLNAVKLNLNDPINATSVTWGTSANFILALVDSSSNNIGVWHGAVDKYLSLKIMISSSVHYGWARLDVASNAKSFTIKDYAYDTNVNKQILAGDKGFTGIKEADATKATVYVNDKTAVIDLKGNGFKAQDFITINNLLGQELKRVSITDNTTKLDISDMNTGVYFITINSEGQQLTKKVYIR